MSLCASRRTHHLHSMACILHQYRRVCWRIHSPSRRMSTSRLTLCHTHHPHTAACIVQSHMSHLFCTCSQTNKSNNSRLWPHRKRHFHNRHHTAPLYKPVLGDKGSLSHMWNNLHQRKTHSGHSHKAAHSGPAHIFAWMSMHNLFHMWSNFPLTFHRTYRLHRPPHMQTKTSNRLDHSDIDNREDNSRSSRYHRLHTFHHRNLQRLCTSHCRTFCLCHKRNHLDMSNTSLYLRHMSHFHMYQRAHTFRLYRSLHPYNHSPLDMSGSLLCQPHKSHPHKGLWADTYHQHNRRFHNPRRLRPGNHSCQTSTKSSQHIASSLWVRRRCWQHICLSLYCTFAPKHNLDPHGKRQYMPPRQCRNVYRSRNLHRRRTCSLKDRNPSREDRSDTPTSPQDESNERETSSYFLPSYTFTTLLRSNGYICQHCMRLGEYTQADTSNT